jgi:hypothetical protein
MMLSFVTLLAQAPSAQPQGGLFARPEIMMVIMVVMFYFLLIRPQQRQRKELEKRISALQRGRCGNHRFRHPRDRPQYQGPHRGPQGRRGRDDRIRQASRGHGHQEGSFLGCLIPS